MKKRKAYTLIEVLIVVAIIAILIAILLPVIVAIRGSGDKYLVIDNTTKQEWISIGRPYEHYRSGNVSFKTSSDEGVIIHGSVTIKKLND